MDRSIRIAKDLLSIRAVFFRPEEPFTWASGIQSPVYCDNRLTLTAPEVRDDVEYGLIRAIRSYNLLALIYAYLCMAEMIVESTALPTVCIVIVFVLQCAVMLAFVPVLERGVKKWTT